MKQSRILVFVGISTALLASAHAGPVPAHIKARYGAVKKALLAMDVKAFGELFDDSFTTNVKGQKPTSKADFLKQVTGMFADAKHVTCKENLKSATKSGDVIDVSFDFTMTIQQKKGGKLNVHEVGTDSWKQVGGVWKMVKTVDDKFDVTPSK